MKRIGVFKISSCLNLSHMGIVAVGTIVEGKILPGAMATVEVDGRMVPVKIKGVGWGKFGADGELPYSIQLSINDNSLRERVEVAGLKGQTIDILVD